MQSPPLESSGLITTIHATQVTPLQNQEKEQDQDKLCLSQSLTLPIGLADAEEKLEKESKENNPPATPRKQERPSQGMEHTLLITLMRLTRLFQSEQP